MAAVAECQSGTYSSEEVLKEVRNFVKGSSYESKVSNEELVKSALFLLRALPSARDAVLEHLCNVFDEAVKDHLTHVELGSNMPDTEEPTLDAVVSDIHGVLMSFVKTNPEAWAPIISAWSIDLLGQISSKYSDRRGVPHSNSLNEMLQLWMTCKPTRTLIEIASECLASMIGGAPDVCVDALLVASVKHSPHFDWVVAHIGSCFPTTIITRVLKCGLKDFCHHGNSHSDLAPSTEEKVPKMASVVGILGHLAGQHGPAIRHALLGLFQESLAENADAMSLSAVPFLLHLASMSSMLLRVITTELVHTLSASVMIKVVAQFKQWPSRDRDSNSLLSLVVHLITKTDTGALELLNFILKVAAQSQPDDLSGQIPDLARKCCGAIMDRLLLDLQRTVHSKGADTATEVPFLVTLQSHTEALCCSMLQGDHTRSEWLLRLLCCLAVHGGESCTADILSYVLCHATQSQQLSMFLEIQQNVQLRQPDVVTMALGYGLDALEREEGGTALQPALVLNNVLQLIKWEKMSAPNALIRCPLYESLQAHLNALSCHLYHPQMEVSSVAMEILNLVGSPRQQSTDTTAKLCSAGVHFFFQCLHSPGKMQGHSLQLCKMYLSQLGQHPVRLSMILRFLIEGAMHKENAALFGATMDNTGKILSSDVEVRMSSVLEENRKHALSVTVPQTHSTVFHAGVIGQGRKPPPKRSHISKDQHTTNKQILLEILWACCHDNNMDQPDSSSLNTSMDSDAGQGRKPGRILGHTARLLACIVVEMVVPDVMYNSLYWPEEEFNKVTVERDLVIKKKFDDNPVLWDILELISCGDGALFQCSVILRGIMATLLTFWEGSRESSARNSPRELEASCCLLECLRKGNLLPPPLCYVGQLFPLLSPYEVCLLLQNTWRYFKENPAVLNPDIKVDKGCETQYTDIIRSILHSNIDKLGHLYSNFFMTTLSQADGAGT